MIDLKSNRLIFDSKIEMIESWEVWWMTPKGLIRDREQAVNAAMSNGWPIEVIRPVTVAVGPTFYEVAP